MINKQKKGYPINKGVNKNRQRMKVRLNLRILMNKAPLMQKVNSRKYIWKLGKLLVNRVDIEQNFRDFGLLICP